MLTAHIQPNTQLTYAGELHTITCKELNIQITSRTPEGDLCRAIMKMHPEYSQDTLKVYRGTMHCSTMTIGKHARSEVAI